MSFELFLVLAAVIAAATVAGVMLARDDATRAAFAIGGPVALIGVHALGLVRFRADDSYITYRYARNFADGLGPVWNEGERVEGYTSFLWMLLLAAFNFVGIDIEVAALLLAIAAMFALFVLIWRVSLRLTDGTGAISPHLLAAGAGLLVASSTAMGVWSMSGLEVPLIAALLMALVLTYQRESRDAALFPASALVLAASVMTRPEANAVAALTGTFFLAQALRERDARRWRQFAAFCVTFAVVAGGWFLWRWWYYGWFFPNTYYVKVGPLPDMIDRGWAYTWQYAWSYLLVPSVLAAAALPALLRGDRRRDALFMAALSIGWLAAVILEGGDAFPDGRFIAPVLPVIYLASLLTLTEALRRARAAPRIAPYAIAAAVVVGAVLFGTSSDDENGWRANRIANDHYRIAGQWIHDNAPADYTTAVFAAGITPYYSERPSLDMLGLTDEAIAHTDVAGFGSGTSGHEKYNLDYALEQRRPEIIAAGGVQPSAITKGQLMTFVGPEPGLVPGFWYLVKDPRTWELYEMAAFFYDGNWYSIMLRKDIAQNVNIGWTESEGLINGGRGR